MPGTTDAKPDDLESGAGWRIGFLRGAAIVEDAVLVTLLSLMIAVAVGQILLRNLFDVGLSWSDQLSRVLVLWVGLLGALTASKENKHITIAVLSRFLSPTVNVLTQLVTGLFTAAVCALMSFYGARFVYMDSQVGTIAFGLIPLWILELILPVGFGLISIRYSIFSINQFIHRPRGGSSTGTRDR